MKASPSAKIRGVKERKSFVLAARANRAFAKARPIPPLRLKDGDTIEAEIPRIGLLINRVEGERSAA
jgi:2-keto-4-pentenoate hydratase/2-oxohepta-3-ene-1,7-dioic acid hydratase in catechol pathway